ncbi:RNA-directed DNA polymerase from mobile element jockey [Lucilia cuprina]|nr:RNA-directed DNA polymerase from mobile element jockey [Lucilia cuprina]
MIDNLDLNSNTLRLMQLIYSDIQWNLNKGFVTGACLIDFEKAFDNIWIPGLIAKLLNYEFPIHLIISIYNMLNNKDFQIYDGKSFSSKEFIIVNGLQQGTVCASILFNLYIHDLLNSMENIIGFADDIIVYHADNKIVKINRKIQYYFHTIEKYAMDWQMKINLGKCETILFRPPVGKCNNDVKRNWKSFNIKSLDNIAIPNKQIVKYLGIYLDKFLYFNEHINCQIIKTKNALFSYKKLFFSKIINSRVKIIMYQTLIRPILTYGCQIWYNISPSYMEKMRVFERKCLRHCTSLYRTANNNYKKYVPNKILYNKAKVSRIDNFIIHLIRDHIVSCLNCHDNNLIMAPYHTNDEYISKSLLNGYVPPEAFLFLDKNGYIQNEIGIPIIYHIYRRANIKAITCRQLTNENIRFDTSIFTDDKHIKPNLNTRKYWWLTP